jgi:opacity protein-like surface antigen
MDRTMPAVRWVPALLLAALLAPQGARAEFFFGLRAGESFTDDGDIEFRPAFGGSASFERDYEDSITGGGRAGFWLLPWFGLAGDASYFAPDDQAGEFNVDVVPISLLLMLRVPLASSDEFPNGRVQPFLGLGPGIFVSVVDFGGDFDDTAVDIGFAAHAGLEFLITRHVGLFAEYGFTTFTSGAQIKGVDVDLELSTHHAAGGVAFHF